MAEDKLIVNINGGEISPLTYGRVDSALYQKSVQKSENFLILPQGGYKFRNGTAYVHTTRTNSVAWFIPFQFNDLQAYIIEATPNWFRFYTQNGIVLNASPFTISGVVTGAVTTFTTSAAHGMSAGAEVFIQGYVGNGWDTLLNGKYFPVTVIDTTHFSIPANSTGFAAATTVGTITAIYEIATPYLAPDLPYLQIAQITNTAYIANNNYEPRKLVRSGNANWSLATYSRTTDPFPSGSTAITAITQANPGVITATAHGLTTGTQVFLSGIVGMTQLNGNQYLINVIDANTFSLTDLAGNVINTTGFTAYVSGGTVQPSVWPRAVSFTDSGRLMFAGTPQNPMTFWASAAPTTSATRYDVFTGGSLATDALSFTLAPTHGRIDTVEWITSTSQSMVLGCYGSIRTLFGTSLGQPITPSAVNSSSINTFGAVNSAPVSNGYSLFYIQRGGLLLRSADYTNDNLSSSTGFTTTDRNFVSEHLTTNGLRQCVETQGQPDFIWVSKYDGKFLSLTFNAVENVSGWARHYLGGASVNTKGITVPFGKILSISSMLRNQTNSLFTGGDQIWFCVERSINGSTVRSVEYMTDAPIYPIRQDFNANITNTSLAPSAQSAADKILFLNAMFESQKTMCHLDMSSVYDGSLLGISANATLTPSAISGTGITITASNAVFTAAMVGRQIWKQYDINGNGGGRAYITAFTDSTHITVDVLAPFDNVNAMNAGGWYLTATTISNLDYLNGSTVSVTGDGSYLGTYVVSNGSIALTSGTNVPVPVSYCTVGLPYIGSLVSLDLKGMNQGVPQEAIARVMHKVVFNFVNASGTSFGTDIYAGQTDVQFRSTNDIMDRAVPLFSGIKWQTYLDSYNDLSKELVVTQKVPLPMTVTSMDAYIKTQNAA